MKSIYQKLIENSIDPMAIANFEGFFLYVNKALVKALGYTKKELYSKHFTEFLHPDDIEASAKEAEQLIQNRKKTVEFKNRYRKKDGSYTWFSWNVSTNKQEKNYYCTIREITKQVNLEENLKKYIMESRFYREALDQTTIIAITDTNGIITYANEKFCQISKYSLKELTGKTHRIINSKHHKRTFFQNMWETISKGCIWRSDVYNKAKDGSFYWVDTTIVPMRDVENKITGYLSIRKDITKQKTDSIALEKSNDLLETIRKIQSEFYVNPDKNYVFSMLLNELLRITESEYGFIGEILVKEDGAQYLKTHAITDISWDEDTQKLYQTYSKKGFEFYNLETLFGYVIKNNKAIISNEPVNDKRRGGLPPGHPSLNAFLGLPFHLGREFVGMVGIANKKNGYTAADIKFLEPALSTCSIMIKTVNDDIRRKANEREIKSNTELLKLSAGLAKLGAWDYDVTENYIKISDEIYNIISIERKPKLSLEDFLSCLPPDTTETFRSVFQTCLDGKNCDIKFPFDHEKKTWLRFIAHTEKTDNKVNRIYGLIQDITDQKKIEEKLIHAKNTALEAANTKANFLSTMSHEIRTPMNAVIGIVHILLNENPREDQIDNLNNLKFASENLLSLINDILDFSKLDAGKMALENINFNLFSLLNGIIENQKFLANEKNIKLHKSLNIPDKLQLIGDPTRISQVLNNLINNAIKFTEHGHVKLEVNKLKEDTKMVEFHFSIRDTGIGIKEEKLQTIFDGFSQADSNTTRLYGGTGLGLSITKKILELMDSEINVKSELNMGTEFNFNLEFNKDISPRSPINKRPGNIDTNLNDLSILLVEDNPINVMVASKFLKLWNISFDVANNGEEAILAWQNKKYDIILMDLLMPRKDGFETTEFIRQTDKNTTIIALSANTAGDLEEIVKKHDMNGYVTKPFHPDALKQILLKNNRVKQNNSRFTKFREISESNEFFLDILRESERSLKMLKAKYRNAIFSSNLAQLSKLKHYNTTMFEYLELNEITKLFSEGKKVIENNDSIEQRKSHVKNMVEQINKILNTISIEMNEH